MKITHLILGIFSSISVSHAVVGVDSSGGAEGAEASAILFEHLKDSGFSVKAQTDGTELILVTDVVCQKVGRDPFTCVAVDMNSKNKRQIVSGHNFAQLLAEALVSHTDEIEDYNDSRSRSLNVSRLECQLWSKIGHSDKSSCRLEIKF